MKHIKTVDEFNEIIKKEKVLVDFYADWCGPCQMLGPILEEISAERDDLEIVKVNVDNFFSLAKKYGVMSIPALKLFKEGNVIKQTEGFLTKKELLDFINQE